MTVTYHCTIHRKRSLMRDYADIKIVCGISSRQEVKVIVGKRKATKVKI